ncbi:hypothetical protein LC087_17655 [Bacillus carboniphilus]|uniref:Uncharacterized protein n=1 Tax=Bacillus carboniphilus TaxID=86663 RepID=A0ABY9JW43_9BACI|nr:hypothetical protein [Bacillus carboniphilus]WLR42498.1 hypothetical protein LC087_17655 [Bacillus carboniphilus]
MTDTKVMTIIIASLAIIGICGAILVNFFFQEKEAVDKPEKNLQLETVEEDSVVEKTSSHSQQTTKETEELFDEEETNKFIDKVHSFYNETTGFGKYKSLDSIEQQEYARTILKNLDKIQDPALQEDVESIKKLAERVKTSPVELDDVLYLHRYFHDLDIILNKDDGDGKYWGVTIYGELYYKSS